MHRMLVVMLLCDLKLLLTYGACNKVFKVYEMFKKWFVTVIFQRISMAEQGLMSFNLALYLALYTNCIIENITHNNDSWL